MIEQLGPYQIEEQISKGGMGTVYKAYHPALDRHVAIKVLASRLTADATFVRRFKREAQIVARLEHPHILPVYDFSFDGDTAYLVMKLVNGSSLYGDIGPSGMTPDKVLQVLEPVAQALAHAHRRNIIHRDIKPDNILIDDNGWVYLTDFGMAKMVTATGATAEGTIMGTPEYMSPEQAQGKPVDLRSDVYSLSVLVFHILSGNLPFKGNHPVATIKKVIYDPLPEVTSHNPALPKLLDPLLQKGASKNPNERFADVLEFYKMLQAVLSSATLPQTQELVLRKSRIAVLPFSANGDQAWLGDAVQELIACDLRQSPDLYVLPNDHVIRMCRNIIEPNSRWTPELLQRFFELARVDYLIFGRISDDKIHYQLKISTTFETLDEGTVEGRIPFHLIPLITQQLRTRLDVKEAKVTSVEQLFHGNVNLLQQFALGVHAYRQGRYLDAERALRLAAKYEPDFAPTYDYLARVLTDRGLNKQARETIQVASRNSSSLPLHDAALLKAQYLSLTGHHDGAAELYHHLHNQFPDVIEFLVQWGESLVRAEKLDEAANVFYRICEKEERLGLGWQRLAWIECMQEKYEQGWYHYKRAEKLYAAHQHSGGLAATYMGLAAISEQRKEWNTATDYYQRAAESFGTLRWPRGIAEAKLHWGLALKKQGGDHILPLLKESLDLFHQTGSLHHEVITFREILSLPLEIREALEFADQAFVAASELQDDLLIASIIPLKLKWLVQGDRPDTALRLYGSYYNLLLQSSPDFYFALSQVQVARALAIQQRFDEAQQQIGQAIKTLGKQADAKMLAEAVLIHGEIFLRQKDTKSAHRAVDDALASAEKLTDKELTIEAYLMRARVLQTEKQRVQLLQVYLQLMKLAEDIGRRDLLDYINVQIEQLRLVNPH